MFASLPESTIYAFPTKLDVTPQEAQSRFDRFSFVEESGVPLAIYIHIPYCIHICNFCGFFRSNVFDRETLEECTRDILKEIEVLVSSLPLERRTIGAVMFGGGTASLLSAGQIAAILEALNRHFSFSPEVEMTFEGECKSLNKPGYVEAISSLGFSRLSFGVQTIDRDRRKVLNLKPKLKELFGLREEAGRYFDDVSIDMIYGWPGQRQEESLVDLECLIQRMSPDSIDLFRFEKIDASYQFLELIYQNGSTDLTTPQLLKMYGSLDYFLRNQGYEKKSMNFYSKSAHDRAVYAGCYYGWERGEVLGVGRGAQSFFGHCMWGSAMPLAHYQDRLRQRKVPINDFNCYRPREKEWVTWVKRGWVDRCKIYGHPSVESKFAELKKCQLITQEEDRYILTRLGEGWASAIMAYLVPERQRQTIERFNQANLLKHFF